MQRRTVLQMVLSSVALYFAPLTALVCKKLSPLRGDMKYMYRDGGSVLEVTGTPEQLCAFYHEYQSVLWPLVDQSMGAVDRATILAPLYKQVGNEAQRAGCIQVIMQGYPFSGSRLDPYAKATAAAVLATGCVLTGAAATVMHLLNTNNQRPSCTEERC